jgi:hypothetical protein
MSNSRDKEFRPQEFLLPFRPLAGLAQNEMEPFPDMATIVFLALLVGDIPRLNYSSRLRQLIIAADPGVLDHGAAGGHRLLLILGGEGLRTELSAQRLQNLPWRLFFQSWRDDR